MYPFPNQNYTVNLSAVLDCDCLKCGAFHVPLRRGTPTACYTKLIVSILWLMTET